MEECKPSSDAEETLVENGSASPPEDKIRGTFDSQNKGATNISEEIPILEGSVPPEYENFVPDSESKKNEDESKEKEEDEEKKHIEVNSVEKETDHEEAKEVVQDCGDKGNEDESDKKEVDDEKKHTEEKKHIEVNSVEKETDPEEAKEVVQDRGDKGNEDESDKKEVDDEKKHTEETAVAKETDNEESKEGEKIEASDTMEEENKIEETNEENMIEATGAVSKENDLAKDDKETRDTNVSTEDVKMVDEEGDKGEEGETTDMVKPNDIKELREDKMTDVASTVKSEDVKVADVEGDKVMPLEDVKMVETPAGESEEGIEEKGVEQEPQGGENDMDRGKNGSIEKEDKDKKVVGFKRKRSQVQKTKSKGGDSMEKAKELLNSPITSSMERPVRERKTVERLVEVIEKERSREFQVEKGRGTPLKDIPSVAHKLARKKPADIKLIHQTLFGRRGKAVNFKNHILQFSGFVWHESDEKQRAKMKEKLDKYVKDTLLDLCDLFDLPASKANSRKEELVEKLLDFLVAPHPNTEQSTKSRKRKRASKGNLSKGTEDNHSKRSRKKQIRDEASLSEEDKSAPETDDEDDVNTSSPHKGKAVEHSESEDEEDATHEVSEEDVPEKEVIGKDNKDKKKVPRQRDSVKEKARSSSKQELAPVTTKSSKASSSKLAKPDDDDNGDVSEKVSSRKKKRTDSPKEKTIRSTKKEKDTGKKVGKDKAKQETQQPGKEELRKKICEILKEVDFNTATFTDILKRLATHYKTDLTLRKASIKLMIQEELTKLAEAEEDEDDDEEEEPNAEKVQVKKQKVT